MVAGAGGWELTFKPWTGSRESRLEMAWVFGFSKVYVSSDTIPPTNPQFLNLHKKSHRIGAKFKWEYGGHLIQTSVFYSLVPRVSQSNHDGKCIQFSFKSPHRLSHQDIWRAKVHCLYGLAFGCFILVWFFIKFFYFRYSKMLTVKFSMTLNE